MLRYKAGFVVQIVRGERQRISCWSWRWPRLALLEEGEEEDSGGWHLDRQIGRERLRRDLRLQGLQDGIATRPRRSTGRNRMPPQWEMVMRGHSLEDQPMTTKGSLKCRWDCGEREVNVKSDEVVNVARVRTSEMTAGHKDREKGRQGEVRHWSREDRLQDFRYKKKVMDVLWREMWLQSFFHLLHYRNYPKKKVRDYKETEIKSYQNYQEVKTEIYTMRMMIHRRILQVRPTTWKSFRMSLSQTKDGMRRERKKAHDRRTHRYQVSLRNRTTNQKVRMEVQKTLTEVDHQTLKERQAMCRSTTSMLLEVVLGTIPARDAALWRIPDDFFAAGGVTRVLALRICGDMGPSTWPMLVQWLTWTPTARCWMDHHGFTFPTAKDVEHGRGEDPTTNYYKKMMQG